MTTPLHLGINTFIKGSLIAFMPGIKFDWISVVAASPWNLEDSDQHHQNKTGLNSFHGYFLFEKLVASSEYE